MIERPILFNGDMVKAILDGRTAQTRRVVQPTPGPTFWDHGAYALRPCKDGMYRFVYKYTNEVAECSPTVRCPYGTPGDQLWVRERHALTGGVGVNGSETVYYHATDADQDGHVHGYALRWRRSIHMPRWASRIMLEVVAVRVERVNAITAGDAEAEGVDASTCTRIEAFQRLWDSINAPRGYGWVVNPLVWVITFRRVA